MGIHKLAAVRHLRSTDPFLGVSAESKVMIHERFKAIVAKIQNPFILLCYYDTAILSIYQHIN